MPAKKKTRALKLRLLETLLDYTAEQHVPMPIQHAVVFIARHIGDTMGVYPVIRALQAAHAASITIVVNSSAYAALSPLEAEGITFYRIPHERDKRAIMAAARHIRRTHGQIDVCIQAMTRDTTATLLFLRTLKARCNMGLHASSLRLYAPHPDSNALSMHNALTPAPLCWAQLMKDMNIAEVDARFELPVPDDIDRSVRAQVEGYGKYVALNLDASDKKRTLTEATAIQIIRAIECHYGYQVVITCAPNGEAKAQRIAQACTSAHVVDGERSIYHSAAIVKYASAVISPDTSIVHIASAYNRPTIGIYRIAVKAWPPLADRRATLVTGEDINTINTNALVQALHDVMSPLASC